MTYDDEFDHILENSQRVLKLNAQYENHPYVEEFTKERSIMFVYGTYLLEGVGKMQIFLWLIYGNYFRKIFYKTTHATFAGK